MSTDSPVFEWVCDALVERSSLGKLQADDEATRRRTARGTVRLALHEAGLDSGSVSREEMRLVLEQVLPYQLEKRRVKQGAALCADLVQGLLMTSFAAPERQDSPESLFARFGRSS